jgi:hypothetical protein
MTVCGKESAQSLDVSFNLSPSGEVIYHHGGLPHYALGSLTIAPTGDDGALVGLIGDKLFGYLYPWEVYGELRKQTGPYASPPPTHTLTVRLSKGGSWWNGYKLKGTLTGIADDCRRTVDGKALNTEGRVITVDLTRK